MMLEPLIVLTVLNCLFMFSSTVTTCALWWQHRSQHSCPKRPASDSVNRPTGKSKQNSQAKKTEKSKLENLVKIIAPEKFKAKSTVSEKNNKSEKKKLDSELLHSSEAAKLETELKPLIITKRNDDLEEKRKMSEASQTSNDTKSAVVMEFSTIQKVVQILDKDSNSSDGKLVFKEFTPRRITTNKGNKLNLDTQQKYAIN